jgi:predicted XRE-type DNA-binding protein
MAGKKMSPASSRVRTSTGNVFKDLGFAEARTELAKAELANLLISMIEALGLTQRETAKILGIDQPGVSHLVRGNLKRFSMDRLFRFLHSIGDFDIVIKPRNRPRTDTVVRMVGTGKKRIRRSR